MYICGDPFCSGYNKVRMNDRCDGELKPLNEVSLSAIKKEVLNELINWVTEFGDAPINFHKLFYDYDDATLGDAVREIKKRSG